jgi:hypothetical protein
MSVRASLATVAVVVGTVFVVGCSQMGQSTSPTAPSSALTAPTSLAGGTSVSLSQSSRVAQLGPGASYDATGSWHFVTTDQRTGEVLGVCDAFLTQDSDGNISFTDCGGHPVSITRVGSGRTLAYKTSASFAASPCNVNISGTTQVDTTTNTGVTHLSGTDSHCSQVTFLVTFAKN